MKVICVGSGSNMKNINEWDTTGIKIVGVNNVWRGTDKWDHLIHAGDYPFKKDIVKNNPKQQIHSKDGVDGYIRSYTRMANMEWQKARIFLGLPIYFTATYWALYHLKPTHIGFIGFDMNYTPKDDGSTAFYGVGYDMQKRGIPDPLYQFRNVKEYKDDPDILNKLFGRLDDKKGSTELFNLSDDPESVLPWEQVSFEEFGGMV